MIRKGKWKKYGALLYIILMSFVVLSSISLVTAGPPPPPPPYKTSTTIYIAIGVAAAIAIIAAVYVYISPATTRGVAPPPKR